MDQTKTDHYSLPNEIMSTCPDVSQDLLLYESTMVYDIACFLYMTSNAIKQGSLTEGAGSVRLTSLYYPV